jgi:uncharacterized phage-associated protein
MNMTANKKLEEIILYICDRIPQSQNGATKINKLLWFIESEYYRKNEKPLTGIQFVAINEGPVIDNYSTIFKTMASEKLIKKTVDSKTNRHLFTCTGDSTMPSLSDDEKIIVYKVVEKLGGLNEPILKQLSHKDAYYITLDEHNNTMGNPIDLELTLLESTILDVESDNRNIDLKDARRIMTILKKDNIETESDE